MSQGKDSMRTNLNSGTTNILSNTSSNTSTSATNTADTNSTSNIKVIKRYQNRKLYDTKQSCYVTLDDIAKMIRAHEEIVVIDNKSKCDITAATLTQIIFEAEKKSSIYAPLFTLREIIQNANGSISSYLAKLGAFPSDYTYSQNQVGEAAPLLGTDAVMHSTTASQSSNNSSLTPSTATSTLASSPANNSKVGRQNNQTAADNSLTTGINSPHSSNASSSSTSATSTHAAHSIHHNNQSEPSLPFSSTAAQQLSTGTNAPLTVGSSSVSSNGGGATATGSSTPTRLAAGLSGTQTATSNPYFASNATNMAGAENNKLARGLAQQASSNTTASVGNNLNPAAATFLAADQQLTPGQAGPKFTAPPANNISTTSTSSSPATVDDNTPSLPHNKNLTT